MEYDTAASVVDITTERRISRTFIQFLNFMLPFWSTHAGVVLGCDTNGSIIMYCLTLSIHLHYLIMKSIIRFRKIPIRKTPKCYITFAKKIMDNKNLSIDKIIIFYLFIHRHPNIMRQT